MPSSEILRTINRLNQRCESIAAVMGTDFGHIVEVLKKIDHEQMNQISKHLGLVHRDYQDLFRQLISQATAEKQQERRRE